MVSVERISIPVSEWQPMPEYGDLLSAGTRTLVVNEDPYAKGDGLSAMAFEVDDSLKLVLDKDGKAKSVFLDILKK